MSRVLVTGGFGYVGGRVAAHLADAGRGVRVLTTRARARWPEWAEALEVVTGDVRDRAALVRAVEGVDAVVHLAAVNELVSRRDPERAVEVNGIATGRLLDACRDAGGVRIVYFSTFHVYGPAAGPVITEATPVRPAHPYAFSHSVAEGFVDWHRREFGAETVTLRLSNGFGYPMDPHVDRWTLVFNDLCRQAVTEGRLVLKSAGTQSRDFIALADVARAVEHVLGLPASMLGDGLFNLGGKQTLTIREVAERVAAEYLRWSGRSVPIELPADAAPAPEAVPVRFDVSRLERTGFGLTNPLARELHRTFEVAQGAVAGAHAG